MQGPGSDIILGKLWEIMKPHDDYFQAEAKRQRTGVNSPIPMIPGSVPPGSDVLQHWRQHLDNLIGQQQQQQQPSIGTQTPSSFPPPPSSSSSTSTGITPASIGSSISTPSSSSTPPSSSSSSSSGQSLGDIIGDMERLYGKDGMSDGLKSAIARQYFQDRGWSVEESLLVPKRLDKRQRDTTVKTPSSTPSEESDSSRIEESLPSSSSQSSPATISKGNIIPASISAPTPDIGTVRSLLTGISN